MDSAQTQQVQRNIDTSQISSWRSIITLIVFFVTNLLVLFPFRARVWLPRFVYNGFYDTVVGLRIISPRPRGGQDGVSDASRKASFWIMVHFPVNFITAPLIADLFLLAILAIGRDEVYGGTIGNDNIQPIDIMAFFLTLAYIAISIDASGLIRYLAFRVLVWGGDNGHLLYFYLYAFFFTLGSFIGNDPIILSGTAFLAYMTRVSANIKHPRAWIHAQFAIANTASAILVSSNPTNLVLSGAFSIKFIDYTVNMIVPVVITAIVMYPFLAYVIFSDKELIPPSIKMHELPDEVKDRKPVNPNIPNAKGVVGEIDQELATADEKFINSLEEIMNPFLDVWGAGFGALMMAATLITLLAVNASGHEWPVAYITAPAAVIVLCWDLATGWLQRKETRRIAQTGRRAVEDARAERDTASHRDATGSTTGIDNTESTSAGALPADVSNGPDGPLFNAEQEKPQQMQETTLRLPTEDTPPPQSPQEKLSLQESASKETDEKRQPELQTQTTLASLIRKWYRWCQETFPTTTAVLGHLPFALVPFAFCMFVLVQGLVTKGWVPVFAYGWDHWVEKTGTVGAIGGMGFLSVILCNFAGTNIGTTILLSRVIQAWEDIHFANGTPISERMFWATVYSMALGVNYGAFSAAFSGSLAGLLWRDILARKHIVISRLEFARVNLPIIAIAMTIGCTVLVGQIYITRKDEPHQLVA